MQSRAACAWFSAGRPERPPQAGSLPHRACPTGFYPPQAGSLPHGACPTGFLSAAGLPFEVHNRLDVKRLGEQIHERQALQAVPAAGECGQVARQR